MTESENKDASLGGVNSSQIDDIREKLQKIEDKSLAMELLSYFDSKEKALNDLISQSVTYKTELDVLRKTNTELFSRISTNSSQTPPNEKVSYDDLIKEMI